MAAPVRRELDVSVDGRTLRVAEYGVADGVPVVVCHGTPGSRFDRVPEADAYAGFRVVAYDRPGYGGSTPDPGRTVASAAADVAAIADELGLGRFGVLGGSGGGPHALACGALLGDRVTRVAVRCGVAPFDDPEFDALEGIAEVNVREIAAARAGAEASAELLEPIAEQVARDPAGTFDEIAKEVPEADKEYLRRPEVREIVVESAAESVRQGARGWIDDNLAFVASWGFALADVMREVRLWQGELDVLVPRSHAAYMAGKLPNATFELVPGRGHWMQDHMPAVIGFLGAAADEAAPRG
jgi:pimeloyl-ACP methyl ester carboxylesterase